jgi:predicted porin
VSIGGIVEIAPYQTGKVTTSSSNTATAQSLKNTRTAGPGTWSTSVLNISGTEDLGGGLRASFFLMTNLGNLANTNTYAPDTALGGRERSLSLTSANLGTLRFGRFVAAPGTGFHSFSGAGSATLPGSSYGISQGHSTSATTAGDFGHSNFHAYSATAATYERQNNLLQFTSNAINGFTVTVAHGRNALDNDSAATPGKTNQEYTGAQVVYAAGPLSIGFGVNDRKGEAEAVAVVNADPAANPIVVGSAATARSSNKGTLNWVGASYNFGAFTLFGHHVVREDKETTAAGVTTTQIDANLTGFGVSVPMGALTLRASTYSGKDKRAAGATDDRKLTGHQLSAVYALSKRTSLVAATGKNEYKRDGAASITSARKYEATTLTVNHTF